MSEADVTLVLEGSYPYVPGGVSSWVHQLLHAYPDRRFALMHIGPRPGAYPQRSYQLPTNVLGLADAYCDGAALPRPRWSPRRAPPPRGRQGSRVLAALRRIHLEDRVDGELLADLCAGDLSVADLLYGEEAFDLLRRELYPRLGPHAPFIDFFWHFRALHVPLLRLLEAPCPAGRVYHAVSTGYAGLVAAAASARTGRPLMITEHGLYARERELELARAPWISDRDPAAVEPSRPSPLRGLWSHFFRMLSRIAYHRATRVLTLSETNRRRQVADGADPAKTDVVPNGVDPVPIESLRPRDDRRSGARLRVGFVGRVVPIKDVVTLIRACRLAIDQVPVEVRIVGPEQEDPRYARRCRTLVATMGLDEHIHFLGSRPKAEIYADLDVVVLTSISEGQPLVILEAFAAGLPVVATDVGACRELIEGIDDRDRRLGPAGIVTRVASPIETAAALTFLARTPAVRRAMGRAGSARVTTRYQQGQVIARYDHLYQTMVTS